MGRATAMREVSRLTDLSRQRALDNRESWHLQKMITVLRRLDTANRARLTSLPAPELSARVVAKDQPHAQQARSSTT